MSPVILVVDDESAIRSILIRYFGDAGYDCLSAGSVAAAKNILASSPVDLVICDVKMPEESGVELIRYVKEHYPGTGRVMITAYSSPEVAKEILEIGVYGYILKPVSKGQVLITVENALKNLAFDTHLRAYQKDLERKVSLRTEKLTAIMNNLSLGVVMFDNKLNLIEKNKKIAEWFGSAATAEPTLCTELFHCEGKGEACAACESMMSFHGGQTCECTKHLLTKQGEKEFRITTSPVADQQGTIYAGLAIFEDITEKTLLERDLRQAQKLETVGQLAAGIAHEINSPIQFVGDNISFLRDSFADMADVLRLYQQLWSKLNEQGVISPEMNVELADMLENADVDYILEEIPKTVEQSLEGVRRVEKIVRSMKEFSHPGSDEKMLVDINKLLETTITVCRNEWKYVAQMKQDFAPDLPLISCFSGEIGQVFLNLIVNGAQAIGECGSGGGAGLGEIRIETRKKEDGVEIRISDTGGGIPVEIQERVYDSFFTTKVQGKGTGQGLAIARRVIVDNHQGKLFFTTEKGKGTTFVIELPCQ